MLYQCCCVPFVALVVFLLRWRIATTDFDGPNTKPHSNFSLRVATLLFQLFSAVLASALSVHFQILLLVIEFSFPFLLLCPRTIQGLHSRRRFWILLFRFNMSGFYARFGVMPGYFDASFRLVSSPLFSPSVLALIRLSLGFYTLTTLIFDLTWESVKLHDGDQCVPRCRTFSFLTNILIGGSATLLTWHT